MAVWRDNPDLMARLTAAQNVLQHIDIVTFAGMCDSREELLRHVEHNEDYAQRYAANHARKRRAA